VRPLPLALLLAGCAGPAPAPATAPDPLPAPVSAKRIGVLGSEVASRAGAILYDGGASVELPDGRTLWTFGDTFFGERGEPADPGIEKFLGLAGAGIRSLRGAVCHTAYVSAGADVVGAAPGAAWFGAPGPVQQGPLVPPPPEEPDQESLRVWLMDGIHARGRVLLFYGVVRILKDAAPPFNFEVLGVGLAEGDPEKPPLRPVRGPLGWRVFPRDGPAYGAAVLQADMGITEGFDYVYGTKPEGGANRVFVARVPHGDEAKPESWYFHRGGAKEWSPDPSAAVPIFEDAPGDLSVSWNPHFRRFLAVHSRCLSGEVVARVADRPEGPWSAPTLLFTVPAFAYGGKEQAAGDGGRVLVVSVVDSREGVPGLWRVTLP
jgi:hypothetical protein